MSNGKKSTVCGAFCADCSFYGKDCKGCTEGKGVPFWAEHNGFKACPIHDCCVGQERLVHCGHCKQMPCQMFRDIRDPSMTDEQFNSGLAAREAELKRRCEAENARCK